MERVSTLPKLKLGETIKSWQPLFKRVRQSLLSQSDREEKFQIYIKDLGVYIPHPSLFLFSFLLFSYFVIRIYGSKVLQNRKLGETVTKIAVEISIAIIYRNVRKHSKLEPKTAVYLSERNSLATQIRCETGSLQTFSLVRGLVLGGWGPGGGGVIAEYFVISARFTSSYPLFLPACLLENARQKEVESHNCYAPLLSLKSFETRKMKKISEASLTLTIKICPLGGSRLGRNTTSNYLAAHH